MRRVLQECDRASIAFAPDPVHDLRVALRRCCSMADGIAAIDPDRAWKDMKKAGKLLFRQLGALRDVHVMQEWVHRLDTPGDPVTGTLLQLLTARENEFKQEAICAVQKFDRKHWQRWSRSLPRRMARLRQGSLMFRHLALERWTEAYKLHRQAVRNRSQVAFHRLRIGLKCFRYIVENFLPEQHAAWSNDLKQVQDVLGDVHDLDVLWSAAVRANVFPDMEARSRWYTRINRERSLRIEIYRKKMLGRDSLWQVWRSELPNREQTESAALLRLKFWASSLDPDFKHSMHVTRLALQLYDGLAANEKTTWSAQNRDILGIAALLHDVGRSKNEKGHHKVSYRMIRRLSPPLGQRAKDLLMAGIVARYHRGALPRTRDKVLQSLSAAQIQDVFRLSAILRLADAFDASRDGRVQGLKVVGDNGLCVIAAQGYSPHDRMAETIAAGCHLLETVYRRPVMVKPVRMLKVKAATRMSGPAARNAS